MSFQKHNQTQTSIHICYSILSDVKVRLIYISQASYKMHRGNIKVRRSLNRCTQKQNVQNLNVNQLNRDKSNFSIPSLTMRPNKLLPHLEPCQDARKLIQNRSKPHEDVKLELRRGSNTMMTKPLQSLKLITLSSLTFDHETTNLLHNYSKDFINHTKRMARLPCAFLGQHTITPTLRARMVDWMIEVLASFKFTEATLFLAVAYMDRYFSLSRKEEPKDLHAIGVISMFMASKMNEVFPLAMRTLHEKVVHKKISVELLSNKEMEMFKIFQFCLADQNMYDIAKLTFSIIKSQCHSQCKKHLEQLQALSMFILKMALFEYTILSQYSNIEIAVSAIILSTRLITPVDLEEINRFNQTIWGQQNISDALPSKLQKLLKNFDRLYPGLGNLKRFNKITLPVMVDYDTL